MLQDHNGVAAVGGRCLGEEFLAPRVRRENDASRFRRIFAKGLVSAHIERCQMVFPRKRTEFFKNSQRKPLQLGQSGTGGWGRCAEILEEKGSCSVDSLLIVADDCPQTGRGEPVDGIHHPQNYSEGQSAAMAVNEKQDADAEYAGAFGQGRPFRQLAGMKRLPVLFFVIGEVCRPRGSDSRHPEFRLSGPRIPVGQPLPARFGPMHDPRFVWQPLRHERRAVPVHFLRASWADV